MHYLLLNTIFHICRFTENLNLIQKLVTIELTHSTDSITLSPDIRRPTCAV